jgi:hypothetical protein
VTRNKAEKIAERVWKNYSKLGYTFSRSLSAGRFKESTVKLAIDALNKAPKNKYPSVFLTKEQFIATFIELATSSSMDDVRANQ